MAGKAAKEQKKLGKISAKLTKKAADNKISGNDTRRLTEKYGSGLVSTALAQMGLANPNLQIGKNVKRNTGLKFFGEGEDRYAQYNPARISGRFPGSMANVNAMDGTRYGDNWYALSNGGFRYGGPLGAALPSQETTDATGDNTTADTPIVDDLQVMLPEEDPIEPLRLDASQYGVGADIPSFNKGWKGRKSQRKKAGKSAQGYNSMTTAPATNAAGVGLNPGPWKSTYIPYMT
jgi:hypothetical protein